MPTTLVTCPGCGAQHAPSGAAYDRKFHASAECWAAFEQVIAREYENAPLFGRVHQLTVDAFAVHHAGGRHPDKSVFVHLLGLCLVLDRGVAPRDVPRLLQRVVAGRTTWPHLEPPAGRTALTVADVAGATSADEHARLVREWAAEVWSAWRAHHDLARGMLSALG